MKLTQGTKVLTKQDGKGYFQNFAGPDSPSAFILLENGRVAVVHFNQFTVLTTEASFQDILREFVEAAVENRVASTELVNKALKVLG